MAMTLDATRQDGGSKSAAGAAGAREEEEGTGEERERMRMAARWAEWRDGRLVASLPSRHRLNHCGEIRWPHASSPKIGNGRETGFPTLLQQNRRSSHRQQNRHKIAAAEGSGQPLLACRFLLVPQSPPPPCWTPDKTLALARAYNAPRLAVGRAHLTSADWAAVADAATPTKTACQCLRKVEKLRRHDQVSWKRIIQMNKP
uniref:Myb-like domain-containing protein n=1 Tax=Leersia perrieri TaxID=77586 RepID=A0A0D9VGJ1_9ORYZ